ncbi:MAG: hypothetical protein AAF570_17820 [Bacteroidota bacterium]
MEQQQYQSRIQYNNPSNLMDDTTEFRNLLEDLEAMEAFGKRGVAEVGERTGSAAQRRRTLKKLGKDIRRVEGEDEFDDAAPNDFSAAFEANMELPNLDEDGEPFTESTGEAIYFPQNDFQRSIMAELGLIDVAEGEAVEAFLPQADLEESEEGKGEIFEEGEEDEADFEPKRRHKVKRHARSTSSPFISTDALEMTRQKLYDRHPYYEARGLIDEVLREVYRELARGN